MWGLIYKDLFLLRKTALWSLAIGTFISLAVLRTGAAGMIVISTSAITYTFMVTALYLEEKNNSLSFLKLLPLPAVRIVDAKFGELGLVILSSILFEILLVTVASAWGLVELDPAQLGLGALLAVVFNGMGYGVALWLFFRLGYQKIRIGIFVFFWFIIYALGSLVPRLKFIVEILGIGPVHPLVFFTVLLVFFAGGLSYLSWTLARWDFGRREL